MAFKVKQLTDLQHIMDIHQNMTDQKDLAHEHIEALQDIMDLHLNITENKDMALNIVMDLKRCYDKLQVIADEHTEALLRKTADEHTKALQQNKAEQEDLAIQHAKSLHRPVELQRTMAYKQKMALELGMASPYDLAQLHRDYLHTMFVCLDPASHQRNEKFQQILDSRQHNSSGDTSKSAEDKKVSTAPVCEKVSTATNDDPAPSPF